MLYCLQVEAAVAAAKEAFPGWSARSPEQRGQVLNKLADLIEAHLEEFAQAESRDQGHLCCFKTCCINPGVSQIISQVVSSTGSVDQTCLFFNSTAAQIIEFNIIWNLHFK